MLLHKFVYGDHLADRGGFRRSLSAAGVVEEQRGWLTHLRESAKTRPQLLDLTYYDCYGGGTLRCSRCWTVQVLTFACGWISASLKLSPTSPHSNLQPRATKMPYLPESMVCDMVRSGSTMLLTWRSYSMISGPPATMDQAQNWPQPLLRIRPQAI